MKKILFTIAILALCACASGQKVTALTESTTAGETSLLIVREGATGDLLKRITKANLFNNLALGGTTTVATAINPDVNDGATLGLATTAWSDLFLANGGVINWGNSDVTLANSNSNYLLLTGDLAIVGRLDLAQGSIDVTGAAISEAEIAILDNIAGKLDYSTENYGATGTGDIVLSTGPTLTTVNITDVIKLTPTASPPTGATEGMIYADTDHHLYYHNGTTWIQIDN